MEYNQEKVAEYVLALLYLTIHGDKYDTRAWKGMDWDALEVLYEKGYIHDPKNKAKSVSFTPEGLKKSEELFQKFFSGN